MKKISILICLGLCLNTNIFAQFSKETLLDDAYDKLNTEKYNEALLIFNSLISKETNCFECYFGRAKTRFFLKDYQNALIDCEKSLKTNQDIQTNYSLLGDIKFKLNDFSGALLAYDKALSIQKAEDKIRNDGKEIIIENQFYLISQLKNDALKNNRPQLGDFILNVAFFDKVLTQKLTVDDLYRHLFNYIKRWENKKYLEFNEQTGEHDLLVNSPQILLDYKGSEIYLTLKSLADDTNPIYYIEIGFKCKCEWFNIKNEAQINSYKQYEYSDNQDNSNSMFGGLDIKYKKGNKTLIYNKFYSKAYSTFSLSQVVTTATKPSNSNEYLKLAKLKYKSGEVLEAMGNVNKAIELNKNNAEAHYFKGTLYFDNIQEDKEYVEGSQTWATMEEFNKAISFDPQKSEYYLKRAMLFSMINQKEKAILDLRKVSEIDPSNIQWLLDISDILIDKKDFSTALQLLNSGLKTNLNAELYLKRAILNFKMGNKKEACLDYKKAENLGFDKSGRLDLFELIKNCS